MPDVNITQLQPEIPDAPNAPQKVTDSYIPETPFMSPVIVTSSMAKKQAKKDMQELSRITGINYQL